jgi:hypothetical protein
LISQLQSVLGKFSPGKKAALRFRVDFTMSNSGGGKSRLELPELGERYTPGPGGPIHPIKAPVMIRTLSGKNLPQLVNRNTNVKG